MALIECHECKAEISDSGNTSFGGGTCPQCGARTLQALKDDEDFKEGVNDFFKVIGYSILGFILFVIIFGLLIL